MDVKNSQFYFFACMVLFPEQVMKVLAPGMNPKKLQKVHHLLREAYHTKPDVKEFIDGAISGELYGMLAASLERKHNKKFKKKRVKDICFRTLFSRKGQCQKSKALLQEHYPGVVKACEFVNTAAGERESVNKIYSIPYLLQRLEARILIDLVAVTAVEQGTAPFTTIHDSYLLKSSDVPLVKFIIEDTFKTLGLPAPTLSYDGGTVEVANDIFPMAQPSRVAVTEKACVKPITLSKLMDGYGLEKAPEVPPHVAERLRQLDERFKKHS
ncbi:hypothetical protein [Pontibacter sp. BAB1700]|uniref:hypothetical protein n=1 Tax=Pontibacter sp. BAB1700 TaxID=1144253 RepID=UPI00026BD9E3|nr:hypothetical protein [Pontibacter sp. BAB1700]EJF10005.1 hypothetical protein O71_11539 [Pontibacter sp. BAB1700]